MLANGSCHGFRSNHFAYWTGVSTNLGWQPRQNLINRLFMFLASYTPSLQDLFLLYSQLSSSMAIGLAILLAIIAAYGIIWAIWYFTKH